MTRGVGTEGASRSMPVNVFKPTGKEKVETLGFKINPTAAIGELGQVEL